MDDKDIGIDGLVPKEVAGSEPGSVYEVAVRTRKGYVAVRHIENECFRVRCERFDQAVLVTSPSNAVALLAAGIGIREEGRRLSVHVHGRTGILNATSALIGFLLIQEIPEDAPKATAEATPQKCGIEPSDAN